MKAFWGRNKWPLLGLSLMVVCVLLCNLFCIPAHDELSYAFAGQNTPKVGECARVASVGDIVRQQIRDYCQGTNGRVLSMASWRCSRGLGSIGCSTCAIRRCGCCWSIWC